MPKCGDIEKFVPGKNGFRSILSPQLIERALTMKPGEAMFIQEIKMNNGGNTTWLNTILMRDEHAKKLKAVSHKYAKGKAGIYLVRREGA